MCVYSMVLREFEPLIPDRALPIPLPGTFDPLPPWGPIMPPPQTAPILLTPDQLQQVLDAFKQMMAAAKKVDEAVGHKDCEDPEKAKLEHRVAELQAELHVLRVKAKAKARKRGKSRR